VIDVPERYGKAWTTDEEKYVQWNWGVIPLDKIAKKLGRTQWGVAQHATKILNLGAASRGTWSIRKAAKYSGFSEEKIKHAIEKLGMNVSWALRTDPRRGTKRKIHQRALTDEQLDQIVEFMLANPYIFTDKPGMTRSTAGAWGVGKKPPQCLKCGRSDRPHEAKGFCTTCYQGKFRRAHSPSKNKTGRATFDNPILTIEQVEEIRWARYRGEKLDKLAADAGVTRQAISQIVKGLTWKRAGGPITPYTYGNINRTRDNEVVLVKHRSRG
jgi:hypothetical protein